MNARLFISGSALALLSIASIASIASLAACSSSPSPGGGATGGGVIGDLTGTDSDGGTLTLGSIPASLSKYCTGTLMTPMGIMRADGSGAWLSDGSVEATSGTEILVSTDGVIWSAYLFLSDGTPARLNSDASPGLVLGTTFKSSCAAATPQGATGTAVLLGPATLYPNMSLTGTACTLPAGTTFTDYSFVGGNPATVSSSVITAQCGTAVMYSNDFQMVGLLSA
jgi:hypothetical protein